MLPSTFRAFVTSAVLAARPRVSKAPARFRLTDKHELAHPKAPWASTKTQSRTTRHTKSSPPQTKAKFVSRSSRFSKSGAPKPSGSKNLEIMTPQRQTLPMAGSFKSFSLLPGLVKCLESTLGPNSRPTPIQSLSLNHFFPSSKDMLAPDAPLSLTSTLLASETGSGKSFAYLLPVLHSLKTREMEHTQPAESSHRIRPRAIILAPTHELCRQLSAYSKGLSHDVKLRTVCLSNPSRQRPQSIGDPDDVVNGPPRPADIVVATPSKIAHIAAIAVKTDQESPSVASRTKSTAITQPRISFEAVEWVVIDEADVLFDRDFSQTVTAILDAIKSAKQGSLDPHFNLILTTATIPASLNSQLLSRFPDMVRITSPRLHRLPTSLRLEHADTLGGNPQAFIHKKVLDIFASEARRVVKKGQVATQSESKVIIFCNRAEKAVDLGVYLESLGLKCVVMSGASDGRYKGSNQHLGPFLNTSRAHLPSTEASPRVLITTSLLARGLDFSPNVSHVLIADEPRNQVDFLHRAGRTGRAGRIGTVVVFGKPRRPVAKKAGF